jgi:hypothetical protein
MEGGCLCGAVRFRAKPPLTGLSHCHCSRCRKAHGSAYATYGAVRRTGFASRGEIARFESSPGFFRAFCPRCGSVVPDGAGEECFVPLGLLDEAPPLRVEAHIFAASKAPWFELTDALPRFAAYPPGFPAPSLPDRARNAAPGVVGGSCLCGAVAFELGEAAQLARFCHCGRCRKARAAAHAANLFLPAAGLAFTRGAERLVSYKVPEALRFTQCFCRDCGGKLPRLDPERKVAIVPMGALDDDPGVRPSAHIFVGSKAAWDEITDTLPQHREYEA